MNKLCSVDFCAVIHEQSRLTYLIIVYIIKPPDLLRVLVGLRTDEFLRLFRIVFGDKSSTFTFGRVLSRPKGSVRSTNRLGPTRCLYSAQPTWSVIVVSCHWSLFYYVCPGERSKACSNG